MDENERGLTARCYTEWSSRWNLFTFEHHPSNWRT